MCTFFEKRISEQTLQKITIGYGTSGYTRSHGDLREKVYVVKMRTTIIITAIAARRNDTLRASLSRLFMESRKRGSCWLYQSALLARRVKIGFVVL